MKQPVSIAHGKGHASVNTLFWSIMCDAPVAARIEHQPWIHCIGESGHGCCERWNRRIKVGGPIALTDETEMLGQWHETRKREACVEIMARCACAPGQEWCDIEVEMNFVDIFA